MTSEIDGIIALEWEMFDRVHNLGGRAPCQNDRITFIKMRSSQLNAWSLEMRQSYLKDLQEALAQGRNLIAEKYGYMMERTDPVQYEQIRDQLPFRAPDKEILIEQICQAHMEWVTILAKRFPNLVGRGRPISRNEDRLTVTSFETYLWGELWTYSLHTLRLYAAYVKKAQDMGRNLHEEILLDMVHQSGIVSLEAAEARF